MSKEATHVDIANTPELSRLAEAVRDSMQPHILEKDGEALVVVKPYASKRARARPHGKPFKLGDPLWEIVGIGRDTGATDVSENKHRYLAEAYRTKGV